jgi:hypothetical protein
MTEEAVMSGRNPRPKWNDRSDTNRGAQSHRLVKAAASASKKAASSSASMRAAAPPPPPRGQNTPGAIASGYGKPANIAFNDEGFLFMCWFSFNDVFAHFCRAQLSLPNAHRIKTLYSILLNWVGRGGGMKFRRPKMRPKSA